MTRYFFNQRHDDRLVPDPEGVELQDPEAARGEAIASVKGAVADYMMEGGRLSEVIGRHFEIADEAGATVFTMSFREAADMADHRP